MLSDIAESAREGCSSVVSSSSTLASVRRPSRTAAGGGSTQSYTSSTRLRATQHSHRPSITAARYDRQQVPLQLKLDNTYRMEPDDTERFQPRVVQEILGN